MLHCLNTLGNEGWHSQWPHVKMNSLPNMRPYIEIKGVEGVKDMFRKRMLCVWETYRSEVIGLKRDLGVKMFHNNSIIY